MGASFVIALCAGAWRYLKKGMALVVPIFFGALRTSQPIQEETMIETVVYSLLIASIFFVYFDATKHKVGKIPNEKRFTNLSAGMWAFCTAMLWIIAFPLYLISRKKLIEKAKEHPQEVPKTRRTVMLGIIGILFLGTLASGFTPSQNLTENELLQEISGVWSDGKGSLISVDLYAGLLHVDGKMYPTAVKNTDLENRIITFNIAIDDSEETLWSIRQVYDKKDSFHLVLTTDNGSQFKLGFVRNLD